MSHTTFWWLPWRSRSQHDLAAKTCRAYNFVIWSRILQLFHRKDYKWQKQEFMIIKEFFEGPVGDYCIACNTIKCLFSWSYAHWRNVTLNIFHWLQILGDKERLIRRSQLKRTAYRVFGTLPKPAQKEDVLLDVRNNILLLSENVIQTVFMMF